MNSFIQPPEADHHLLKQTSRRIRLHGIRRQVLAKKQSPRQDAGRLFFIGNDFVVGLFVAPAVQLDGLAGPVVPSFVLAVVVGKLAAVPAVLFAEPVGKPVVGFVVPVVSLVALVVQSVAPVSLSAPNFVPAAVDFVP